MKYYVLYGLCVLSLVTAVGAEETVSTSVPAKSEGPTIKPNALLQAWALNDSTPTAKASVNYRLRRAELKLSGSVVEDTRYFVMVDPAKAINPTSTDNRILQDLGVAFTLVPGLELTGGQFKTLTSSEGLASSAELLFPERSLPGRKYGDRREPGLMLTYQGDGYRVGAMASNGQGPNADATKATKDLSVRADVNATKEWKLGAFGLFGDLKYDQKGRWGVNSRYTNVDITAGAEYAMGRDAGVTNLGFVVDAGYMLTEKVQPVVRYELYKPNTTRSVLGQSGSLGINYLFYKNNAKIQAAFSYLDNMTGNNGTSDMAAGVYGSLFTLGLQMAI